MSPRPTDIRAVRRQRAKWSWTSDSSAPCTMCVRWYVTPSETGGVQDAIPVGLDGQVVRYVYNGVHSHCAEFEGMPVRLHVETATEIAEVVDGADADGIERAEAIFSYLIKAGGGDKWVGMTTLPVSPPDPSTNQ